MPYYEFKCEDHGRFEVQRPMCDCAKPQPCPVCGSPSRRAFSPPTVNWSGENWQWGEDGKGDELVLSHRV